MATWIGAGEAAERLGVKPATLYAYVSRGLLHRRRADDGRRSLFDPAEVDELAARNRPRTGIDLRIESAITALGTDRPYYRGHDVLPLAGAHSFEEVAGLLWSGELVAGSWVASAEGVRAAVLAQAGLPAGVPPLDRLQVITATLAATDPLRFHLEPAAVAATGRRLITGMIRALPTRGPQSAAAGSVAAALWPALTERPTEPGLVRALDAALVLLADHELAASTLAVRAAASAKADPYAVVSTGLGALGGPMHGGASFAAERLLRDISGDVGDDIGDQIGGDIGDEGVGRVAVVIGDWVRRGERLPGLGHSVYKSGDGRATRLFELIEDAAPDGVPLRAAKAVIAEAAARQLPEPNIDLALATLTTTCAMVPGAGEAIFAVARTAGWLAHAVEEYEHGTLLRPRATYTGPPIA